MPNELKPCPFCGGSACGEIAYEFKEFRIYCQGTDECCPAEMTLTFADAGLGNGSYIGFTEAQQIMNELVKKWNRRAEK